LAPDLQFLSGPWALARHNLCDLIFFLDVMGSQWDNFLQNLGEWQGSFATVNLQGQIVEITPSILSLVRGEEEKLVHFRLQRFGDGYDREPTREIKQEYRHLGKQVIFFNSGSFCKGSMQVAPFTPFGAEFGFVVGDRRHRLVTLYSEAGDFENLVLIREFRVGSGAKEQAPLTEEHLLGKWLGKSVTITADWSEPVETPWEFEFSGINDFSGTSQDRFMQLPDSGYILVPSQVSHREAFKVEAGWLPCRGRLERLIRRYDASGAWVSATWITAKAA
jgi:hypothetical protein